VTSGDAGGIDPVVGDAEVSRADPDGPVARASFRDAAGKESTADLALVRAEHLASGRPWRVFRRHMPDFLLAGRDGGVRVVNVKPADQLAVPRVADALAWDRPARSRGGHDRDRDRL
jgi:hypothetical protein